MRDSAFFCFFFLHRRWLDC